MKRVRGGTVTALLALVLLLVVVAVPTALDPATDPQAGPPCQAVAFMSMLGAGPECP
ncbi:hypothetical protein [Streptomyces sp. NPDC051211]|uniref:hypothetical protein n=1 Tax=Streptomyces sp. NPDC051211 TaxID=3154643 RepID=UPI00344D645B